MSIFDFLFPWRRAPAALPAPAAEVEPAPPRPTRTPRRRRDGDGFLTRIGRRVDSILNTLSGLGGAYDKGTTARPDTTRIPLNFNELTCLYRFNGYAQRFIDIVPADATRKGWKVIDDTAEADLMQAENERLLIVERFREVLQWARLYGGSTIFLVVDEEIPPDLAENPRAVLARPINPDTLRGVLNLVVLDPSEAQPFNYEGNPRSRRFREPKTWMVSPNAHALESGMAGGQIVHHSRILYFPGRRLPNSIRLTNRGFDDSVLDSTWDAIRNKTSIDQAAANLAQELKLNVLKIEGLANLNTSDQADLFALRMKAIAQSKSLINTILVGEGEEFQTTATTFTGFDQLDANAKEALAAAVGMPITLLFGEAPSGLNTDGESGRSMWANVIAAFQQDRLREPLVYLYHLLYRASLGPSAGVEPEHWSLEFSSLDELTGKQRAEVEFIQAQADQIRVQSGILPADHIARSRYGAKGYQTDLLPYDVDAEEAAQLEEARRQIAKLAAAGPSTPGAPAGAGAPAPAADPSLGARAP
jgi:phage-related protein (TIGR01555 family)